MNKLKVAIVIGITNDWIFAAATLLFGLKENILEINPDIIIIQDGLNNAEKDLLNKIIPCKFIEFDNIVPENIRNSRGTHMKFSRLLCFDLLNEYDKVIWLDTDMLILKPIKRLIQYGNTGLAMMPHRNTLRQIYPKQCEIWESDPEFKKYNFDVFVNNTGLMIFSDSLINPKELKNWCFEKMVSWSQVNTSIQPITTLMLQEFNLQVEEIPNMYNCPLNEESIDTVILHAWGNKKFWNDQMHPIWIHYYLKWLLMGGEGPLSLNNLITNKFIEIVGKIKGLIKYIILKICTGRIFL